MTIRFILNDPQAASSLELNVGPLPDPASGRATFSYSDVYPEAVYSHNDEPAFVYWQCREAALRTLRVWDQIAGALAVWQNASQIFPISLDHALGLQAEYNRTSINFYRWPLTSPGTYVAASSDAVAHEVGHALLDATRPDLWNSLLPEVAAFHEGFADCMALLVSLFDDQQRADLIAKAADPKEALNTTPSLGTISESVANAYKQFFPSTNPNTLARRCNNDFKWVIPTNLPAFAPPGQLSQDPHVFGQIFAGCFFDLVNSLYKSSLNHDSGGILDAARLAGRLLVGALQMAPIERRFFQAVGRSMIHVDTQMNGAANHLMIKSAFNGHDILLGSSAMLAPVAPLDGPSPELDATDRSSVGLVARTRRSLCDRLGEPSSTAIRLDSTDFGNLKVAVAGYRTSISLDALGKEFKKVSTLVRQQVLLGSSGSQGAVLGHVPVLAETQREVESMVKCLKEAGSINRISPADCSRIESDQGIRLLPTHSVRKSGNSRRIRRLRFCCCAHA